MKKLFAIALTMVLLPMLFGANDAIMPKPMPTFKHIRIVPVQALPQVLELQRQTEDTLRYCLTLAPENAVGLTGAGSWEGAIRLTPTELAPYAGWDIIAICWYHYGTSTYSQNVKVYDNGTATQPGPVLTTEPYSTSTEEWVRVDLSTPVGIPGSGDLWCAVEITQTAADYPIGVDDGPMVNGKGGWIYFSGAWHQLTEYNLNYNWAIMAIVESGGVTSHDVGTMAILAPGATEMPNTTINPQATYRNFGDFTETFDVYFEIDSLGSLIYSQTANITRDPGMDTTITWPPWTTSPIEGITYDVTAYTVLSGDENPVNDTLTATTTIASAFWKIYTSMPQASYYNAVVAIGSQTVYSVGGYPTYTSIFEFDCATESWTTSSATLNHEAQRTAAAACDGKIYVMGGADAGFTAHNYCQEYDPVAGTVTDKTPLPTARNFNGALTWNDTLIYVLGGQSSSYWNVVEIYDPANDAWTTATPLPEANRSFACGIAGDIIYVTGGYSGSGYRTATRIGVIDPANPQSITWSQGPDIPLGNSGTPGRSRVQGACVEKETGWVFYFTGGDDHGASYPAYDTWFYDPNDALWHQDIDKPTPISNSQCAVYVPNPFEHGVLFCAGGYNTATSSGTNATEGLVNIGTGIYETPPVNQGFAGFAFAAMANPSKGMISYVTSISGKVVLKAYDASGRLIETLINSVQPAGVKTVKWDTSNIANGVYFLRLDAQGETATQKMILVK